MTTKHFTLRLTDEHRQQIAAAFKAVVPDERIPLNARLDSDWQVTEGLRMIASGEIKLIAKPSKRKT